MPVRVGAPPTADTDRPKTHCKVPDRIPNAECTRKTWMLKVDKALDPIDVGFFGSQRIMAQAYLAAHLVQQLELRGWNCRLGPEGSSGFETSAGGSMNV